MKITILSRNAKLYSTKRLIEAAKERGYDVRVRDTLKFSILVEQGKPRLFYNNKPYPRVDAIVPRIGSSLTFFGTAVVRQFEQMGVFSLASSHAISVSRDKLRSFQILSRHHVGIPPTAFVRDKGSVLPALEQVGGAPVIIKLLEGTQGIGVILAETTKMAEAIVQTLQSAKQNVLVQKFVQESKGRDVRALVVGNRVVAAVRRVASGEEFRSNIHRGGRAEPLELSEEYARTAVLAAQIHGLRVAGVDMLEGNDGPRVLEVNSSPGLEGIERATKIDVAGEIISFLADQVDFPDLDLRQRLTLRSGYGVVEIPVVKDSELRNVTLRDSRLRERDILVLNITRGSVALPNPGGETKILKGDVLLCFGKMIALRGLLPPPNRRPRKRSQTPSPSD